MKFFMVSSQNKTFQDEVVTAFQQLQSEICSAIEKADGKGIFSKDEWQRAEGGGGLTRILQNGNVLEKAGVNFSKVFGTPTPQMASKLQMPEGEFLATGVSIVMHPESPMVPIIHMNVRYFEVQTADKKLIYWFGGGIDLTPHYIDKDDARFFHQKLKEVCDKYHPDFYPRFKQWADDYFFIKHRNETRGIGGIFFDRLQENEEISKEKLFDFVLEVGKSFAPIYSHLIAKNKNLPFGEKEKQWQLIRRGRYVEFNLVYDVGTKFGLETNGRIESILMSLPKQAEWHYCFTPEPHSKEAETLALLKKGINWL
jgi:coproporphyrinogen III oxidase